MTGGDTFLEVSFSIVLVVVAWWGRREVFFFKLHYVSLCNLQLPSG